MICGAFVQLTAIPDPRARRDVRGGYTLPQGAYRSSHARCRSGGPVSHQDGFPYLHRSADGGGRRPSAPRTTLSTRELASEPRSILSVGPPLFVCHRERQHMGQILHGSATTTQAVRPAKNQNANNGAVEIAKPPKSPGTRVGPVRDRRRCRQLGHTLMNTLPPARDVRSAKQSCSATMRKSRSLRAESLQISSAAVPMFIPGLSTIRLLLQAPPEIAVVVGPGANRVGRVNRRCLRQGTG